MKGLCYLCGKIMAKSEMSEHVSACIKKKELTGTQKYFRLAVSGDYSINPPDYWLIIEAKVNATLESLDLFLRDVWLECCGHLSVFHIGGKSYYCENYFIEPAENGEEKMKDYRLDQVLRFDETLHAGTKFSYEYDFGSTTELKLKVLGVDMLKEDMGDLFGKWVPSEWCKVQSADMPKEEDFILLARNMPPKFKCDVCNSEATMVCGLCRDNDCNTAYLCDEHAEKHTCPNCGCDPKFPLPMTNSPRDGVCGFTGGNDEFDIEKVLEKFQSKHGVESRK